MDTGQVYTTEACAASGRVYTTEGPELHLNVSGQQEPLLLLDLYSLQGLNCTWTHLTAVSIDYRSLCYIWTFLDYSSLCFICMSLDSRSLCYIWTYLDNRSCATSGCI
jgi:hypothetical protein